MEGTDGTEKATPQKQAPTLSPEKQAMLVLPEESFKVAKLAMSQTDEDFEIHCSLASAQEGSVTIDVGSDCKFNGFFTVASDVRQGKRLNSGQQSRVGANADLTVSAASTDVV